MNNLSRAEKKALKKKRALRSNNAKAAKVADIQFSFRNHQLIEALRKRGQQIAYQEFEKVPDTE